MKPVIHCDPETRVETLSMLANLIDLIGISNLDNIKAEIRVYFRRLYILSWNIVKTRLWESSRMRKLTFNVKQPLYALWCSKEWSSLYKWQKSMYVSCEVDCLEHFLLYANTLFDLMSWLVPFGLYVGNLWFYGSEIEESSFLGVKNLYSREN